MVKFDFLVIVVTFLIVFVYVDILFIDVADKVILIIAVGFSILP